MGINGIYGYQQWDIPREIPRQKQSDDVQNTGLQNLDISQNPDTLPQIEEKEQAVPAVDSRSRIANLEDVSLTFNKEDSFDYIGSQSGLENLDIQKAISDMKKDEVLQGYQYFVGSAQNLMVHNNDDGAVFRKLGL